MIDRDALRTATGERFEPDLYRISLRPLADDEGGGWLAEIPDLPGCTGDGETEMDAIRDVRAAALEWADCSREHGDIIPAPNGELMAAAE